jgi:hypothetical protein
MSHEAHNNSQRDTLVLRGLQTPTLGNTTAYAAAKTLKVQLPGVVYLCDSRLVHA